MRLGVALGIGWLFRWGPAIADEAERVYVKSDKASPGLETRATSTVRRAEREERLPRSAPDALRYEPGVFIQQTAHGQGAPIVRGLVGSRVLLAFDGVRLNNATFRQGPSQYFFTFDAQSIDSITVLRGGASTLFGTDALGGALLVTPVLPSLLSPGQPLAIHARGRAQFHQADVSIGGRAQSALETDRVSVLVGAGYTHAGQLRAGGVVPNLSDGRTPEVPRFEDDGVTQRGTGHRTLAGDAAIRVRLSRRVTAIALLNAYRQFDTPRTDLCPPPFGVIGDCLTVKEQFRTLAYVGLDADLGHIARKTRLRLSYQRQHEFQVRDRPLSFVQNGGVDNVTTLGVSASMETERFELDRASWVDVFWGGDAYVDQIGSQAWVNFTDVARTTPYPRGQYLDGSSYVTMGAFGRGELNVGRVLTAVAGARIGRAEARLAQDYESGQAGSARAFAGSGLEARVLVRPAPFLELTLGADQSYRAPNLTDLSQRQQTGPGFQIENTQLEAERQWSAEAGVGVRSERVRFDVWGFRSTITGYLTLMPRGIDACPAGLTQTQCASSWSRYELVNASGLSVMYGVEGALRVRPTDWLRVQATLTAITGSGPNPGGAVAVGQRAILTPRVPLSRVPPVNGTLEARVSLPASTYAGLGFRWALDQTRLAVNDWTDYRIPVGGTPGYAVLDLRAGYRFRERLALHAQLENLFDSAYRTHGSSVNGAGRGVSVALEGGF
jgi:iron complex outermembrane receptor protein/hemoglobin/transferrin/lactoferrin receptor protein